jgi:PAS domain S-box-containing protein
MGDGHPPKKELEAEVQQLLRRLQAAKAVPAQQQEGTSPDKDRTQETASAGRDLLAELAAQSEELEIANEEMSVQAEELRVQNEELQALNLRLEVQNEELKRIRDEQETERDLLRTVLEQMPAGVIIAAAPSGKFLLVNRRASEILGYPLSPYDSLETYTHFKIFHPDGRPLPHDEYPLAQALSIGRKVTDEEVEIIRQDGSRRTLRLSTVPIRDRLGRIIAGTAIYDDITERKRVEDDLAANLEVMTRLQHLGTLFVRDGKLSTVLSEIVEAATAIAGADLGSIQLLNPETGDLQFVAQRGFEQRWLDFWNTTAKGHGTCGTALERGERIIVEDVEASPIFAGKPALDIHRQAGVRAVQSTPLISRSGQLLGIFSTHYRTPNQPDTRRLALFDLLARQAADIISRAQADQELERTSNQLAEAQKIAHLGSFEYIVSTGTTVWSEEEYRLFGLDPAGPSPAYDVMLSTCIHPGDAALVHETFTKAMQSRSIYELEHRIVQPDGSVRWVYERAHPYFDEQGNLVRYIGTTLDITERKQAEENAQRLLNAIHTEKEKLSALVNSISDEVWFADTQKKFTLANPSALQQFGLDSIEEISIEKLVESLEVFRTDGSPRPAEEAPPLRALQGELVRNLEEIIRTPQTGEFRYREVSSSPVRDGSGNLIGAVSVVRDITEHKRAEEALRRAHDELGQRVQERTAELRRTVDDLQWEIMERSRVQEMLRDSEERLRLLTSQLLTAQEDERRYLALELHDDLGQSLMVLQMQLRALQKKTSPEFSQIKEGLEEPLIFIKEMTERVRRLSRNLRPAILEEFGLAVAVQNLYEELYKKGIQVTLDLDDVRGSFSDKTQLNIYRVFQESFSNIVKHSQATRVAVSIKRQDGSVAFQIEDNGRGFDYQKINQGDMAKRSLGLTAMAERSAMMGGSFNIQSQAGQGTRISFAVPIQGR